ncbi:MAG: hypothetical protein ACI81R_000206 [Bradymonadia bacterium]|jgi:hypothetical protein
MTISSSIARRTLLSAAAILMFAGVAQFADAQRGPGGHGGERFEEADQNSDGMLSLDEMLDQATQRFNDTDADGDGFVTQEEMRAQRQERRAERCGDDEECGERGGRGGR